RNGRPMVEVREAGRPDLAACRRGRRATEPAQDVLAEPLTDPTPPPHRVAGCFGARGDADESRKGVRTMNTVQQVYRRIQAQGGPSSYMPEQHAASALDHARTIVRFAELEAAG